MTTFPLLYHFASNYGAGTYDANNYNGTNVTTTTTTSGGGGLTNTGVMLGLIVGIAALLLCAAVFVRVWKRASRRRAGADARVAGEEPTNR